MTPFKTTQKTWTHQVLFPLMIILILFTNQFPPALLGILGGFTVMLFLFHSLIVEVKPEIMKIKFGPGLIQKKIKTDRIKDCQPIKLNWPHNIGVHWNPSFTVYNVTGTDGVEITLKDKDKTIRVGTDEPEKLCRTLKDMIQENG